MHGHEAELLTTTFLMLSAIGCGLLLKLVKQPPLVGYILAGLFIGPSGMGLIDYLRKFLRWQNWALFYYFSSLAWSCRSRRF